MTPATYSPGHPTRQPPGKAAIADAVPPAFDPIKGGAARAPAEINGSLSVGKLGAYPFIIGSVAIYLGLLVALLLLVGFLHRWLSIDLEADR